MRPRLVRSLSAASRRRLTLVVGPPGSGKSVLVSQWAAAEPGRSFVCLSIERDDNHAASLATKLVSALGSMEPSIASSALDLVDPAGVRMGEPFLAELLAHLARMPETILVFDQLEEVSNRELLAELVSLIEQVASQIHIVVAARCEAMLDLDRLRLRDDLATIGRADLALESSEARELIRRVSGRVLDDEGLGSQLVRTEGWVAGVELLALSARPRATATAEVSGGGDGEYVRSYLNDTVLRRVPARVRQFLVHTSVLDCLTPALCDAVILGHHSGEMLAYLRDHSLFTRPLDREGNWWTYNPMFRDLLRHQLREADPEAERSLVQRAARWHLDCGEPEAAARYLEGAQDWPDLITLVTGAGRAMYEQGRMPAVAEWLGAVPAQARARQPELALHEAVLYTLVGRTPEAERVVDGIVAAGPVTRGERALLDTLRAMWVNSHASPATALAAARSADAALEQCGADELPDVFGLTFTTSLSTLVAIARGTALGMTGQAEAARLTLLAMADRGTAYAPWLVDLFEQLALIEAWSGNLSLAEYYVHRAFKNANEVSIRRNPPMPAAHLALAHVLLERDQLGDAEVQLQQALAGAAPLGSPFYLGVHATDVALLHLARGEAEEGLRLTAVFRATTPGLPHGAVGQRLRAAEARLHVAAGAPAEAAAMVDLEPDPLGPEMAAAAVQAAIANDDLASATARLDAWEPEVELRSRLARELCTAIVESHGGNHAAAVRSISSAVAMAEPEGHLRVFLDGVPPAVRLLRSAFQTAPTPYLRRLVRPDHPDHDAPLHQEALIAPLTDRELDVLQFLPTRLSTLELTAELGVSMNTLKSHLGSIYRKIGVTGRREAVAEAERIGLL